MAYKIINATDAKSGTSIEIEGEPYTVKKVDISKPGRHGHAKCRIGAEGILTGKKKIIVVPGGEKLRVPMIEKRKAQVMNVEGNKARAMDLESYETLEIPIEQGVEIKEEDQVEYWKINEDMIIKRKV
jgi:translation initiation factor 5A